MVTATLKHPWVVFVHVPPLAGYKQQLPGLGFSCLSERVKGALAYRCKPKKTFDEHQATSALFLALLFMVIYTG